MWDKTEVHSDVGDSIGNRHTHTTHTTQRSMSDTSKIDAKEAIETTSSSALMRLRFLRPSGFGCTAAAGAAGAAGAEESAPVASNFCFHSYCHSFESADQSGLQQTRAGKVGFTYRGEACGLALDTIFIPALVLPRCLHLGHHVLHHRVVQLDRRRHRHVGPNRSTCPRHHSTTSNAVLTTQHTQSDLVVLTFS